MIINNHHNNLKESAIKCRLEGKSYRQISDELGVARSTLNGWLKSIPITEKQKQKLVSQWKDGLRKARLQSIKAKSETRINIIKNNEIFAEKFVDAIPLTEDILELFLAGLYLGDGFKVNGRLGLGNSNPLIVKLFLTLIRKIYKIEESKLGVQIFARKDQYSDDLVNYWSTLLNIPKDQFQKTQHDKRAKNPTRTNYYGVCAVNYSDVVLQRRILAIGNEMLKYKG